MKVENVTRMGTLMTKFMEENRLICLLPSNMLLKEKYESLGFEFEPLEGNALCLAALPKGWSITCSEDMEEYFILNEKMVARAYFKYHRLNFDDNSRKLTLNPTMLLISRYHVETVDDDGRGTVLVLVEDRLTQKVVFNAGYARYGTPQYDALLDQSYEFLKANYPDWQNPLNYWED